MGYRYQLQHCPLDLGGAPEGYLVDSLRGIDERFNRSRLMSSVAYAAPLSDEQVKDFGLLYIGEEEAVPHVAPVRMRGVTVGDVFATGKHTRAQLVDILEQRSLVTGEVVDYVCIGKGLGLAQNRFATNFVSVARNRIEPPPSTE